MTGFLKRIMYFVDKLNRITLGKKVVSIEKKKIIKKF